VSSGAQSIDGLVVSSNGRRQNPGEATHVILTLDDSESQSCCLSRPRRADKNSAFEFTSYRDTLIAQSRANDKLSGCPFAILTKAISKRAQLATSRPFSM